MTEYKHNLIHNKEHLWWLVKNIWFFTIGGWLPFPERGYSGWFGFWLEEPSACVGSNLTVHFITLEDWNRFGREDWWFDGPLVSFYFGPLGQVHFMYW